VFSKCRHPNVNCCPQGDALIEFCQRFLGVLGRLVGSELRVRISVSLVDAAPTRSLLQARQLKKSRSQYLTSDSRLARHLDAKPCLVICPTWRLFVHVPTSGLPTIREPCRPATSGARCLAATTRKACASSPGRQEQGNFGPIGPPYGSIIRAWHPCGMVSKNLEMYRTFAL